MSPGIVKETDFFLRSIGSGIFLMFLYDILRIIRRLMKHEHHLIALEDIVYWCICGVLMFLLIFRENDGNIRGFAIGGIIGGMILYHETVSSYFVQGATFLLSKILFFLFRVLGILLRPFKAVGKRISKLFPKLKNGLKNFIKRVKINLHRLWKKKKKKTKKKKTK